MTRSERLLQLIAVLRRHKYPVTGQDLADELGISIRTLYRDIATLQMQGADIMGEAGLGYILKPGFMLPPLMFSEEEIEALVLGVRFVAQRTDAALSKSALVKIKTGLPVQMQHFCEETTLLMAPTSNKMDSNYFTQLRFAIRDEVKIKITYKDQNDSISMRVIHPFGMVFFDQALLILGYCEMREDFRSFRIDRIMDLTVTEQRYLRSRQILTKQWQKSLELDDKDILLF